MREKTRLGLGRPSDVGWRCRGAVVVPAFPWMAGDWAVGGEAGIPPAGVGGASAGRRGRTVRGSARAAAARRAEEGGVFSTLPTGIASSATAPPNTPSRRPGVEPTVDQPAYRRVQHRT
jgi:hypothetical protein